MKQTLWVFGPVSCVRYPLYEIENDHPELSSAWGNEVTLRTGRRPKVAARSGVVGLRRVWAAARCRRG
eukprot:5138440-Prymnesium_polylepis.1